jgi:hypothetical protein
MDLHHAERQPGRDFQDEGCKPFVSDAPVGVIRNMVAVGVVVIDDEFLGGCGFLFFFFNQFCGALGKAEIVPAFAAAWAPPLLALLSGLTLLCYTEDGGIVRGRVAGRKTVA